MLMLMQPTGSVQPTGLARSLSDLVAKVGAFVQVVSISTSVRRWLLLRFVISVELEMFEQRWTQQPLGFSVASDLLAFEFQASPPPSRLVSVMDYV